jgi:predicted Ser/Thr protein kinase
MASFAHALKSFRSGAFSEDQLIAELERILADGRGDETWLLETLDEEHTRVPLPDKVHAAVKQRIEQSAVAKRRRPEGPDAVGSEVADPDAADSNVADPDASRTRLATQFFGDARQVQCGGAAQAAPQCRGGKPDAPATTGIERIKGVGDVLNDRFVLEERIGSGGMSTVYKALDRRKLEADDRNPYVAVKVLNVEFRSHPQSLIALQREAKKSQSLAHPNIVRVYDFDRDGDTVYMTMEYLSGKSLAQIFRTRGFKGMPQEQAMPILECIADALKFAHDNGIIHADFKPANVIITDSGKVKVIDFGIARAFQRPDQGDMEATRFDPGSLGALTPTYASPQMLEHQDVDPRDDVYALGCIAYEMLTGRHPFGRMQATEARDGGLRLERRKGLTGRQWKALKGALAFEREQRTPTVGQLCHDISCKAFPYPTAVKLSGLAASVLLVAGAVGYYFNAVSQTKPGNVSTAVPTPGRVGAGDRETEFRGESLQIKADANAELASAEAPMSAVVGMQPPRVEPQAPTKAVVATTGDVSLSEVTPVLDKASCAALYATVGDGTVNVRGYASKRYDVKRLERELLALPGAKTVAVDLTPVGDEKCAVLDLYEPYWRVNAASGEGTTIRTANEGGEFTEGEPLIVRITTPPYTSYVNLDYYSLDGGVVHMVPGPRIEANQAPPSYAATIGDLGEWIIAEPFGTELVVVLNTPKPLFDPPREEVENGDDYLMALRNRLGQLGKESGQEKITAAFVTIDTKPRSPLDRHMDKALRRRN